MQNQKCSKLFFEAKFESTKHLHQPPSRLLKYLKTNHILPQKFVWALKKEPNGKISPNLVTLLGITILVQCWRCTVNWGCGICTVTCALKPAFICFCLSWLYGLKFTFIQGTLTEGETLSTFDLLNKIVCFVQKKNIF